MTTKRQRVLWLSVLIATLILTALKFAAAGKLHSSKATESIRTNDVSVFNPPRVKRGTYVQRSLLSPKLVWHLNALGDRLEKPGQERLNITVRLSRAKEAQTEEMFAVLEFPERLRLTIQKGNQTRLLTFDGESKKATAKLLDSAELDLLETLVYGSAEHFFGTQMQSRATRFLGSRFRLDDRSSADYDGPYYDVYKVMDQVNISGEAQERLKFYYFNSETLLLDRVRYEIYRNGVQIRVEERISKWAKEQGQQVPRRIERVENGESVFVLTVRAAHLTTRADDGAFSN